MTRTTHHHASGPRGQSNRIKLAQLEITNSQKIHKEILEVELNISQKYIDNLLDTIITKELLAKKDIARNSLDEIVQSLYVLTLKTY
jgi:transcriptional regulator CtsR